MFFLTLILSFVIVTFFFFNDTATTEIYTLSLHDALPICVLVAVTTATAVIILPFTSWDDLTRKSPNIIIARCTTTPEQISRAGSRPADIRQALLQDFAACAVFGET